jgi:hypothetical protein
VIAAKIDEAGVDTVWPLHTTIVDIDRRADSISIIQSSVEYRTNGAAGGRRPARNQRLLNWIVPDTLSKIGPHPTVFHDIIMV